ncbi:hypothetical protein KR093_008902 [Drosophila rubida]|uniref:BHLH domain-containing protein n=1 Tax=Drosophila rubida TaxID=30044 RepID=A0AAD4JV13_9MUSC|nr:hypothetical protein KR093_008902 [Drosophila rubida]
MKSSTYELHNYAELHMELDGDQLPAEASGKDTRKRKASNAASSRRGEKYSLRQKRQKRIPGEPAAAAPTASGTLATELQAMATATAATATKETATEKASAAKAKSSAKTKAPPLSKYRRKTANARERTRMREINMAFEQLRHCVPQSITGEDAANTNEKLTKITTLRLAMKYIGMLSESLQDPSYESDFLAECLRESANRAAHVSLDTDAEAEAEFELELEPLPLPPAKPKKQTKAGKKTPATKRQSKQAKQATTTTTTRTMMTTLTTTTALPTASTASSSPESCYASSSLGSPAFCAAASCSPSSAYASLSSAASTSSSSSSSSNAGHVDADSLLGMRHEQALSELNTLLLESDSDSLHCLDPESVSYQSLLATAESILPARGDLPISLHSSLEKPDVELSLRLLDHSTDSFDFGSDQQPSACISPLATLDSFHPFADLLHGEFPDLFLA